MPSVDRAVKVDAHIEWNTRAHPPAADKLAAALREVRDYHVDLSVSPYPEDQHDLNKKMKNIAKLALAEFEKGGG